ncbi:HEAT repeat domain-containing protein [Roseateles sp. L2-2]|uniref:HEAT repeat domain-containing protein n=1 Tax=Roseateles TaxID=93681 RepID=UPI003D3609B6
MIRTSTAWRALAAVGVAALLSACAPASYLVKTPAPSGLKGTGQAPADTTITVVDLRKGAERDFSTGILPAGLRTDQGPIQAPVFLAETLQAELASRGINAKVKTGETGQPALSLQTFRMLNHRSNGFSPFVTFTYLSADIDTPSGKKRVTSFVKRGKVPVWSFEEVIEPTMNQPLSLAVKELASKIAAQAYGWKASDAEVQRLLDKLTGDKLAGDAYLDVYALGFSNSPKAVDRIVELTRHGDEYVRLAAISSVGTLGATGQMGMLKALYERRDGVWADRAMALKSIGDLGTPDSRAYLEAELKRWETGDSSKEAIWTAQIIRLYL